MQMLELIVAFRWMGWDTLYNEYAQLMRVQLLLNSILKFKAEEESWKSPLRITSDDKR